MELRVSRKENPPQDGNLTPAQGCVHLGVKEANPVPWVGIFLMPRWQWISTPRAAMELEPVIGRLQTPGTCRARV